MASSPTTTVSDVPDNRHLARVVPGMGRSNGHKMFADSVLSWSDENGRKQIVGAISDWIKPSAPEFRAPALSKWRLLKELAAEFPIIFVCWLLADSLATGSPRNAWGHVVSSDIGAVFTFAILIELFSREGWRHSGSTSARHLLWVALVPVAWATLIVALASSRSSEPSLSFLQALPTAAFSTVGLFLCRKWLLRVNTAQPPRTVLIVGTNQSARRLAEAIDNNPDSSRVVAGLLDEGWRHGDRVLGSIQDLPQIARAEFIDEVIVALPHQPHQARSAVAAALRQHLNVSIVPELFDCPPKRRCLEQVDDIPLIRLHEEPLPVAGLFWKRVLDLLLSAAALIASAPLQLAIAVAIKLDSRGPVFHTAPRAGRKGRPFLFYKFRTMRPDAERLKDSLRAQNERQGPIFKITHDPRVTRIGRFLRRYSLDELPQLWNVLIGDMSLVGPRPHPLDDIARYQAAHLRRLDMTPGLTGPWQVSARRDASFETSMSLDLDYIENWSFAGDLLLLAKTIPAVLRGTGV